MRLYNRKELDPAAMRACVRTYKGSRSGGQGCLRVRAGACVRAHVCGCVRVCACACGRGRGAAGSRWSGASHAHAPA